MSEKYASINMYESDNMDSYSIRLEPGMPMRILKHLFAAVPDHARFVETIKVEDGVHEPYSYIRFTVKF